MKEHVSKKEPPQGKAVAPAIAATSKALDRRLRSDSLKGELLNRQDAARLEPVGVINAAKVSGRIAANAKKLERKMSADNLKSLLESRPSLDALKDYNIYPKHSTSIHNQVRNKMTMTTHISVLTHELGTLLGRSSKLSNASTPPPSSPTSWTPAASATT